MRICSITTHVTRYIIILGTTSNDRSRFYSFQSSGIAEVFGVKNQKRLLGFLHLKIIVSLHAPRPYLKQRPTVIMVALPRDTFSPHKDRLITDTS